MRRMLMTFLQGTTEKTADLEGAVTDTAKAPDEISRVQDFFAEVYAYLTSTEFIGNVIASALVVFLGLFAFRILTHGLPRACAGGGAGPRTFSTRRQWRA